MGFHAALFVGALEASRRLASGLKALVGSGDGGAAAAGSERERGDPATGATDQCRGDQRQRESTFSRRLAGILGLPCHEMDALFWLPGWQQPLEEDFRAKVAAAVSGPEWVLDGNYSRTQAIKWAEVECVVWLDYSFARTVSQSLQRVIGRSLRGREIWPGTGNRESFWQAFFSKKSILLWMLKTFRSTRERYRALMEEGSERSFPMVRIGSREAAEEVLRGLRGDY